MSLPSRRGGYRSRIADIASGSDLLLQLGKTFARPEFRFFGCFLGHYIPVPFVPLAFIMALP